MSDLERLHGHDHPLPMEMLSQAAHLLRHCVQDEELDPFLVGIQPYLECPILAGSMMTAMSALHAATLGATANMMGIEISDMLDKVDAIAAEMTVVGAAESVLRKATEPYDALHADVEWTCHLAGCDVTGRGKVSLMAHVDMHIAAKDILDMPPEES
jgi:hypothetical protein